MDFFLQLRAKKYNYEGGGGVFSYDCEFIFHINLQFGETNVTVAIYKLIRIGKKTKRFAQISQVRMSQNCDIKSSNYIFFILLFSEGNKLSLELVSNSPSQVISNEALLGHTLLNLGFKTFRNSDDLPLDGDPPPCQFYNVGSFSISVIILVRMYAYYKKKSIRLLQNWLSLPNPAKQHTKQAL